ncbi:MAG: ATP-dependent sacrificial sulfur transferase LarE [Candidatus Hadarchaeum sp.]|uniref:ATP-dependent sacrificial sulfur transferase LarE n=1 Tax=Candidatus Hadarchaeum sp. TaxID=2883567 RepID=UPI003D0DDF39
MRLEKKLQALKSAIAARGSAVIAFSGGVDSSLVCAVSHEVLGGRAVAVTAVSPTYPPGELESARKLAESIGIRQMVIKTEELKNPDFYSNPPERCYHCKRELLERLEEIRRNLVFDCIFDGTNRDDHRDFRPGLRALTEFGVISPLAEAGLTKNEVRELASKYGLPNAEKPASPCLASRIPFGQKITKTKLQRIARAEEFIRSLGFNVVRVRDHEGLARVEVGKEELPRAMRLEGKIVSTLQGLGYDEVILDRRGYRTGGANL